MEEAGGHRFGVAAPQSWEVPSCLVLDPRITHPSRGRAGLGRGLENFGRFIPLFGIGHHGGGAETVSIGLDGQVILQSNAASLIKVKTRGEQVFLAILLRKISLHKINPPGTT